MARELLGNVKGPKGDPGEQGIQGPKGDTGEPGGFNNEKIGVQNLLDITKFTTYNKIGKVVSTVKNGVINYTSVPYYIQTKVSLKKGNHVFRIKDYTSQSHAYAGKIRFQLLDDTDVLHSKDMSKGELFSFNVDKDGEYNVQLRISDVTQVGGFIEKPMLVEGDYSVLWNDNNPSIDYSEYRMFESKIPPNVETKLRPYYQGGDFLGNVDSELVLTTGVWLINWNFYINNQNGDVRLRLYKDDELIADKLSTDGYENLSRLINVESDSSQIRFTVHNTGDNELTMSTAVRNNMQLKKL